jgi:internalin A
MLPPTLTALSVNGTRLSSPAELEKLSQLTSLTLEDTGLTSLARLEKLPQLTTLNLSGSGITNIKTLSNSHSLKTLSLPKTVHLLDGLPAAVNRLHTFRTHFSGLSTLF